MLQFPKPDVEQFFQSYSIFSFAVTKDEGRLIFSSNLNGQPNLWAMELPNGYPYPLTFMDDRSTFIKPDREGRFIITDFDHHGNESYHLYALPPEGGAPLKLVQGEEGDKFYFSHLSKDGERLYYMTSIGNPNFLNAHRYNLLTGENELLLEGDTSTTFLVAVNSSEEQFVYKKSFSNTHQISYLHYDDKVIPLAPDSNKIHTTRDFIFTKRDTLLFITNYESKYKYVMEYDLKEGTFKPVCQISGEEIENIKWHEESGTLYIFTDKGIEHKMYAFNVERAELTEIKLPTDIVEQAVVAESGNVYILARGAVDPFNIYRYSEQKWEMLTKNIVIGLGPDQLVYPDVVHYNSFDGLEIEALLFKAKEDVANGYTIFWPHGGPQASEGKFFRSMFQFMLAHGYNIFAPNFRGSTGYGSEFEKMVEGDWGEGPRLDCLAGMDWLFDQGISSPERLFVVGGSFGGYMTLLLAGRHADYFRATVDICGPSNLFTFLESVPEDWKPMMDQWLGHPERDRERLLKDSPITYAEQMIKPMMIIQGANDPRVVKAESDQLVALLEEKGVEVQYIVMEDEGHGFSKRKNEINVYRSMLDFLNKHREC
ncbi:dipeptidyl aminopeptidase/acylaminoacyl peptidase [Paenibacillus turicensis]|uniref:Dipeptidyl aminopeptidase/acylaminoacyl peptidase n=1 Tax=Paenibacillus turicensis TaxID=160487 RepID=A0ABS4FW04_9BACL|nr:prolyl oligopeptidase family serine peptidase [Paenibacillus turicensis]MBP1906750.1 dipeptidyl aminopeptidase/acylaminoacyl peptidase [Paenibacillus turicensis]